MITCFISSCGEDNSAPGPDGPATNESEQVYYNGNIYTVNEAQPHAEAMYVVDGYISYIGSNEEAQSLASDGATIINLEERFVMPGIHDVHLHPLEAASENFKFILEDDVTDPEDYIDIVADANAENSSEPWLLGWGHLLETIIEAERSPKEMLDEAAPDRPVAIMEQTSHSIWCNSKALELMGIDASSANPTGGIIMKGADGEPNGILIDNAGNLMIDFAISQIPNNADNDYAGLVEYALPELAKNGITSICDARTYWKRDHHLTWKKAEDENLLTVRANLGLWLYPTEDDASQIATLRSLYENNPEKLVKINQIKLYSDGIIHNTTSAMHDDFQIDYFGESTNNGLNYLTESRLSQYISALEPNGFDFHIHAIGNRGIHEGLNAIQQSGSPAGRHRITHTEFVDPADYARFASLNVTADAQVAGDFTKPEHWQDNAYLIGSQLSNNIIPLRSLSDANARITLSSDWDVSTLSPFTGMQNAVERAPQALTLAETIRAYTINAAYVMRQEDVAGSLEVGKAADFIVLDRDLTTTPTNQIEQTQVLATYLEGKAVYQK